nr:carboxypeptidase regulatory-like domain-containing protein [Candidatus Magasanikbacteria bacterium]
SGIYMGSFFVLKSVYDSRLRILENGILNEQIEIIRNLPYDQVGILHGSPAGALARTVTTTRNNIPFTITRTIRNIDDPYDGTIGGTPNDIAPADYKMVQVEIMCDQCQQKRPISMETRVGPRALEGDPTHGALFIQVFDAAAVPVVGASVHVVASTTDPSIDLVDTTDNTGMLKLVDLPSGINAYAITVTKDGYTTERTIESSATVLNPVHPPASVVAQNVTQISFAIDLVSSLQFSTINLGCSPINNVSIALAGTKLIGTNPDIPKINENFLTDNNGEYAATLLDWDNYSPVVSGYDVVGTIPQLPVSLAPGVNQPIRFILGSDTARSLVVDVRDSITKQPIANATVDISGPDNDTEQTGVGYIRQTDWSGGAGQLLFANDSYYSDDGSIENNNLAGDLKLRKIGQYYLPSAQLESSIFDVGTTPNYVSLVWEPFSQPVETGAGSLRFQIATSVTTSSAVWAYKGPDGSDSTYYDNTNPILSSAHNNERYLRYKLFLSTASTTYTPVLSDISVSYTNDCTPPGQAYFGNIPNGTYTIDAGKAGYQTSTIHVSVAGDTLSSIELSAQ